jgi:hypothetical protein
MGCYICSLLKLRDAALALTSFNILVRDMILTLPAHVVLGWLMNRSAKEGNRNDSLLLARQQLTLIFVAVHTTSTTITNM